MKALLKLTTLTFAVISPLSAIADSSSGTGPPSIQLDLDQGQRVVLALNDQQSLIVGSANIVQGYAELHLDAFSAELTKSNWGEAHILLGCGLADVLVYQNQNGSLVEVSATQVAISQQCVEAK